MKLANTTSGSRATVSFHAATLLAIVDISALAGGGGGLVAILLSPPYRLNYIRS